MISQAKTFEKKIENLIHAGERLAAIQYQVALYPDKPKIQEKANKIWMEWNSSKEELKRVLFLQENGRGIAPDKSK